MDKLEKGHNTSSKKTEKVVCVYMSYESKTKDGQHKSLHGDPSKGSDLFGGQPKDGGETA